MSSVRTSRAIRMADVAASAGVSRATVSLVLRGDPRITPDTQRKVLTAADRLGYVYNQAAANLRTQHNNIVALVMPDIINPFVGEVSMGAQRALSEFGYFVVVANTNDDLARQRSIVRSFIEQRVAGIVNIPVLGLAAEDANELSHLNIPIVLLTRELPGSDLPFISPDDRAIGRIGAKHLIGEHHCTTVSYFGGNRVAAPRTLRHRAFSAAVRRARRIDPRVNEVKEWSIAFDPGVRLAYEAASRLLEQGPPPDGILCHSDQAAYGLLKAMQVHGLTVEDCRVIGIDNLDYSDLWTPSLTTIDVNPRELGRLSGRVLLQLMGHPAEEPIRIPPPRLVPRGSCGCTPG